MEEMRNAYKKLFGKPQRKEPICRTALRREDNINAHCRGVGLEVLYLFQVAQERSSVEGFCRLGEEPSGFLKAWRIFYQRFKQDIEL
jgi:hypothetical protein